MHKLLANWGTICYSIEKKVPQGGLAMENTYSKIQELLHQKADQIDQQIHKLTALRDTLRHVADCPAPSHMECPTFQRLVEVTGKNRRKPRSKTPDSTSE